MPETLVVIPALNAGATLRPVLEGVARAGLPALVVDDGSAVPVQADRVLRHDRTLGYGRSLLDGLEWAHRHGYRRAITMDADLQHDPRCLPRFLEQKAPLVLGSRYLPDSPAVGPTPPDRRELNREFTGLVNRKTGLRLSDVFSGYLGFELETVRQLDLNEEGFGFCLQLWMRAGARALSPVEIPVPRIYPDPPLAGDPVEVRRRRYLEAVLRA